MGGVWAAGRRRTKKIKVRLSYLCNERKMHAPRSFGLSATSQQYFSLRTNQPPTTSHNQPAVLFSQNKPAPAISHQPTEQTHDFKGMIAGCYQCVCINT
jgi:hypothetical protein